MKPVVQLDRTGCGFASVAALAQEKYATVKSAATELGIAVSDSRLWGDTFHVRRLLERFRILAGKQTDFTAWDSLPSHALLAIKWHRTKSGHAWHWVVFVRDAAASYVLDPKKAFTTNRRTDFGRMKPKWFIPVTIPNRAPISAIVANTISSLD